MGFRGAWEDLPRGRPRSGARRCAASTRRGASASTPSSPSTSRWPPSRDSASPLCGAPAEQFITRARRLLASRTLAGLRAPVCARRLRVSPNALPLPEDGRDDPDTLQSRAAELCPSWLFGLALLWELISAGVRVPSRCVERCEQRRRLSVCYDTIRYGLSRGTMTL